MKKASIKDVASKAEVSIATVSQILNNKGDRFSQDTIQKVMQARDELGYVANSAAKNLKGAPSPMIGVVIPSFRLPFFADIIQSMQTNAPEHVNLVFMGSANENLETSIYSLVERGVDALIFGRPIPNHDIVNTFLEKRGIPFLVLDQNSDNEAQDRIMVDEYGGGASAAQHLLDLGHQKIAVVTPFEMTDNMLERLNGFVETLKAVNIVPIAQVESALSKHGGLAAAQEVTQSGATAVFVINDEMAIGLMRGLKNAGVKVPDDISVVGYDDTDYAEFVIPALTTVAQPVQAIGDEALQMILNRLANRDLERQMDLFELKLIVRESTGPIKK